MTWVVIDTRTAGRHIMPEAEAEVHLPAGCACGVKFDTEAQAHVHASFEGLEVFEKLMDGIALVSHKDGS